jgi:hypothetical protein
MHAVHAVICNVVEVPVLVEAVAAKAKDYLFT